MSFVLENAIDLTVDAINRLRDKGVYAKVVVMDEETLRDLRIARPIHLGGGRFLNDPFTWMGLPVATMPSPVRKLEVY